MLFSCLVHPLVIVIDFTLLLGTQSPRILYVQFSASIKSKQMQFQTEIGDNYALLFQQGDEQALSYFYHALYPALVHYSHQLTSNRSAAEDIVSEAFVKTWRHHHKLNSYAGIKAYLYRVVHRDSVHVLQEEQKQAAGLRHFAAPTDTDTPFDKMVRSEVYGMIHAALKELSPARRKVVIMHYLEGKTTGEISRELNLHPSTVKTQKTEALKTLRKLFVKPLVLLSCLCNEIFFYFS